MIRRLVAVLGACAVAGGAAGTALAAGSSSGPPPTPTAANGKPVRLVASGLQTPTAFAFGDHSVFAADGGASQGAFKPGGVFVLKGGKATLVPGSPAVVFGLAWHDGKLYGSGAVPKGKGMSWELFAWSGFNGSTFAHQKVLYRAPKRFPGFNGIAFGRDGRLYVGVDVGLTNDHGPAKAPYQYDILSFSASGKHLQVYATGIRQPWQMVFARGSSAPLVTDFGQDKGKAAKTAPDFLLKVHKGDNYGFPQCNWTRTKLCKGFAKPFQFFAPHTDNGGIGIIGKRLYMSQFGFVHKPQVVWMPVRGGKAKPFITGFVAPIIGLGVHGGYVYVGELGTGLVYRVHV